MKNLFKILFKTNKSFSTLKKEAYLHNQNLCDKILDAPINRNAIEEIKYTMMSSNEELSLPQAFDVVNTISNTITKEPDQEKLEFLQEISLDMALLPKKEFLELKTYIDNLNVKLFSLITELVNEMFYIAQIELNEQPSIQDTISDIEKMNKEELKDILSKIVVHTNDDDKFEN